MIRDEIFVVLLPAGQFLFEARQRLVGPCPVPNQARETIDRRVPQRSIDPSFSSHATSHRRLSVWSVSRPASFEAKLSD